MRLKKQLFRKRFLNVYFLLIKKKLENLELKG